MAESIIPQKFNTCLLCEWQGSKPGDYGQMNTGLHRHHIMHGTANRALAEKYGVWCYLCPMHHTDSRAAVHQNAEADLRLKQYAQMIFEQRHGHEAWMQVFDKNYL